MSTRPTRFAVAGADHLHLFELAGGLVGAGAVAAAHVPKPEGGALAGGYERWQPDSVATPFDAILADPTIDLVLLAGVPRDRAALAVAALEAGKAVLSDKPGVTTPVQLERLRAAVANRPGRPWTVLFSERLGNRAVHRAVELAREGAVGEVVHVIGNGPHTLAAEHRPEWFWDPTATGGILVDIGSHQIDQFVALAGDPAAVEVVASRVGNVACPDRPSMQDIGTVALRAPGMVGDHRVDYLSPAGLDTWGDVRLTVVGTTGTLEVRANVDAAGQPGGEHLILVDADDARRIDVSGDPLPWPELLLADLADDGERLMSQHHVLAVCDLALRAQAQAEPWPAPSGSGDDRGTGS